MIYIASDHTGFELKKALIEHLKSKGLEVEDCGAFELDPSDDYPDFIAKTARGVANDTGSLGIVIGGSGQGEAICANKVRGIRAVLFYAPATVVGAADITGRKSNDPFEMLRLTREHNDANVLSLAARFLTIEQAKEAVDAWLSAKYNAEERHARRIEKIKKIEEGQ